MPEWCTRSISDLLESHWPGEWGTDPRPGQETAVVYRSTDIDDEGHLMEDQGGVYRTIPPEKLRAKRLAPGDVLLEASGGAPERPVGRVALFTGSRQEPAVCANFVRVLRPKSGVSPEFLRWALYRLHEEPAILRYQQQTTGIINLNVPGYLHHEIDVPPPVEQRRIAAVLSTIDQAIEQTEALVAKHEQIKAGLMQDLFTRGILPDGRLRPSREEAPDLYKETELGHVPKDWDVVSFGGCLVGTPQNGLYKPASEYGDTGTPIVRIDSFYDGLINRADTLKRVRLTPSDVALYGLSSGDILVNRVNSIDYVGKSALVSDLDESMVFESNIMRCRLQEDVIDPAFAILWLGSGAAALYFHSRAKSAIAQASINQTDVKALPVPLPSMSEQQQICDVLATVTFRLDGETQELSKMRQIRQGLMQDLLTGRVRVPVKEAAIA